jgi:hypothetical protein
VAEHGESHTWSGHTHTRPEDGARVKYIARFELPEKYQRKKQFLVCPICRPNSRNFGRRDGYIAWFPDEWLIRLIGPDCFAEIDKQGHADRDHVTFESFPPARLHDFIRDVTVCRDQAMAIIAQVESSRQEPRR